VVKFKPRRPSDIYTRSFGGHPSVYNLFVSRGDDRRRRRRRRRRLAVYVVYFRRVGRPSGTCDDDFFFFFETLSLVRSTGVPASRNRDGADARALVRFGDV